MDSTLLNSMFKACQFDLCALENDPVDQQKYKCSAYTQLNSYCLNINQNWRFNWRTLTNCSNLSK